jgi:hypothetical protein
MSTVEQQMGLTTRPYNPETRGYKSNSPMVPSLIPTTKTRPELIDPTLPTDFCNYSNGLDLNTSHEEIWRALQSEMTVFRESIKEAAFEMALLAKKLQYSASKFCSTREKWIRDCGYMYQALGKAYAKFRFGKSIMTQMVPRLRGLRIKRVEMKGPIRAPSNWTFGTAESLKSVLPTLTPDQLAVLEDCVLEWEHSISNSKCSMLERFLRAKTVIEVCWKHQDPILKELAHLRFHAINFWSDRFDVGFKDFRDFYIPHGALMPDCYYIDPWPLEDGYL